MAGFLGGPIWNGNFPVKYSKSKIDGSEVRTQLYEHHNKKTHSYKCNMLYIQTNTDMGYPFY
jgi:hypothetical protein